MRSILALVLALLILAAEAPGLLTESPVCAAVDGRGPATATARGPAKPCCGTAACPMHRQACGAGEGCSGQRGGAAQPQAPAGKTQARLCAASCGAETVRVVPATPDPGTLEASNPPAADLRAASSVTPTTGNPSTRTPKPAEHPPRV